MLSQRLHRGQAYGRVKPPRLIARLARREHQGPRDRTHAGDLPLCSNTLCSRLRNATNVPPPTPGPATALNASSPAAILHPLFGCMQQYVGFQSVGRRSGKAAPASAPSPSPCHFLRPCAGPLALSLAYLRQIPRLQYDVRDTLLVHQQLGGLRKSVADGQLHLRRRGQRYGGMYDQNNGGGINCWGRGARVARASVGMQVLTSIAGRLQATSYCRTF